MRLRRLLSFIVPALLLGAAPMTAMAQTGSVVGTVVKQSDGSPISGAQVRVVGTNRGAVANAEGRYVIPGVPAGEREVRVINIGYASQSQTVTVPEDGSATADFQLTESAVEIDGLMVTATGQQQQKREIGSSVASLQVDQVELSSVGNISELLQGRISGVSVTGSGGTTGSGDRIRIRGSNSVSLSNSPLVIIDGIRIEDDPGDFTLFTGGQQTSRLNDLNPEDIESIEVLRGPSASALYGTAAANGVIQITTKRGSTGDAQWQMWAEGMALDRSVTFPANWRAEDASGSLCQIRAQAAGDCSVANIRSFNPLEVEGDASPFRQGWGQTYGASVSGGNETTTYYVSGEFDEEVGGQKENDFNQVNLRANVTGQVKDNLRVSAKVGYTDADAQLPQNDNSLLGLFVQGLSGSPSQARVEQLGGYLFGYETVVGWDQFQNTNRFTGSATADWQPLDWLRITAVGGIDDVNRHDNDLLPAGPLALFGGDFAEGFRESWNYDIRNYTATGDATAEFDLTPEIRATASTGVQYFEDVTDLIQTIGVGIAPGTSSLNGTSPDFVGETNIENKTLGTYATGRLAYQNKLFVNGAVRGDKNSAFGTDLGWIWYPSFSGSWVMSEEDFFPEGDAISSFRLRAAWGQSGLRPSFRDALQFFDPIVSASADALSPGFVIEGAGNPNLEPQRSTEWEFGFEAGLFDDRLGLDLTYYNKESEDDIIASPLPPSAGAADERNENLGLMTNKGVEWEARFNALRTDDVDWTVNLVGSHNTNELESLGDEPQIFFGILGNTQTHNEGFPAGAYWDVPIESFSDADGNGIISADEITLGEESDFLGQPFPKTELSVSTSVSVGSWLTLFGLADYKGGQHLLNWTQGGRCDDGTCRAVNEPGAVSLFEQARAVAFRELGTVAGYVEEADFWKIREVSATFRLPPEMANQYLKAGSASLTLAGRNLATFTDYSGFDPEVLSGGSGANFSTWEGYALPPFRSFSLRVNLTY